jgi:hypothetical protein
LKEKQENDNKNKSEAKPKDCPRNYSHCIDDATGFFRACRSIASNTYTSPKSQFSS